VLRPLALAWGYEAPAEGAPASPGPGLQSTRAAAPKP
jgi:hypothetical protein